MFHWVHWVHCFSDDCQISGDPGNCEGVDMVQPSLQGFVLAACHLCALGCGAAGLWPLGQHRMLRLLLGSSSWFWLLPDIPSRNGFLRGQINAWMEIGKLPWQFPALWRCLTKSIGLILEQISLFWNLLKVCWDCWDVYFLFLRFGPDVLLGSVALLVLGG